MPSATELWWARHRQAVAAVGGDPETFLLSDPRIKDLYYLMLREVDPDDDERVGKVLSAMGAVLGIGPYPG